MTDHPTAGKFDASHVPVGDLLSHMARELLTVGSAIKSLEGVVAALTPQKSAWKVEMNRELQSFDMIAQSIEAIAAFAEQLGQGVESSWRVDARSAAKLVLLSELADRLVGSSPDGVPPSTASSGACEIFG